MAQKLVFFTISKQWHFFFISDPIQTSLLYIQPLIFKKVCLWDFYLCSFHFEIKQKTTYIGITTPLTMCIQFQKQHHIACGVWKTYVSFILVCNLRVIPKGLLMYTCPVSDVMHDTDQNQMGTLLYWRSLSVLHLCMFLNRAHHFTIVMMQAWASTCKRKYYFYSIGKHIEYQ